MKNPKAKRMMVEAMRLAQKAVEVEEGKQKCAFCQLEVLGGNLVEHYTSHYSLEQPGLLVKVLVAKNTKANLRCPLPTCDNEEMEGVKLDLHIATEHDILKAVLEEDARLAEKKVIIESLFPFDEKVHDVSAFTSGDNSVSDVMVDPKGMVKVEPDVELEENGEEDSKAEGHCEEGEIEDFDSEEPTGNTKDGLKRIFDDAKTADKIETPIEKKEEAVQPKRRRRRRFEKDSPAEWSEKRRAKEELVKEALAQIAVGTPTRVVSRQFRLSRKTLAKRVKEQDTRGWVKGFGRTNQQSSVMSYEEESRFAESLRKQFNQWGKLIEWKTLKSLLQRHLQNLVEANPSRLTGYEATNQIPNNDYVRRFENLKIDQYQFLPSIPSKLEVMADYFNVTALC